jgi:uncharacterized protein (TIGR02996 family)
VTERLALLKAILAAPNDDLPRLVFADWLEENGTSDADAARAEFIRLGCLSKAKLKITSAETRWLDANWQRLLPSVIAAAPKRVKPQPARQGRFLRILFYWKETGRTRTTDLSFEFVRGFVRRAEFSNGHGYERFWQAIATDEPLAYHRPELRPSPYHDRSGSPYARLLSTTWGGEVYVRTVGFSEEVGGKEKVYRRVVRGASAEAFHPLAVADERGIDLPQHRARTAVATAMTARAREFVGLS